MTRKLSVFETIALAALPKRMSRALIDKPSSPAFASLGGHDLRVGSSVVETESGVGVITAAPRSIRGRDRHEVVVTVPEFFGLSEKHVSCGVSIDERDTRSVDGGPVNVVADGFKQIA